MEAQYHALTPAQRERLLNGPALAPPPGIVPNFDNPPNNNRVCYGIIITGICLVTFAITIRLYTRIFYIKKIRVEDCLMIAATGLYIGFTYEAWILFDSPGGFAHQWDIRVKDLPRLMKNLNIAYILYGTIALLLKVSILLDWINTFAPSHGTRGTFYYACAGIITTTILFYTACLLVEIFPCTPRSKLWNVFEHGTCRVNIYAVNVASSAFNFVLDLAMLGMPQQVIWKLQLSRRRKIAISLLFAVGILGCVCGALRIVYSIPLMTSEDKAFRVTAFALSGTCEMIVGFLVFCIPSLPKFMNETPILKTLFSRLLSRIGLTSDKPSVNSRQGLPSWIRIQGQRRERRRLEETNYSEIDSRLYQSAVDTGQSSDEIASEKRSAAQVVQIAEPTHIVCTTDFITAHGANTQYVGVSARTNSPEP